jgi:hypothetical protein
MGVVGFLHPLVRGPCLLLARPNRSAPTSSRHRNGREGHRRRTPARLVICRRRRCALEAVAQVASAPHPVASARKCRPLELCPGVEAGCVPTRDQWRLRDLKSPMPGVKSAGGAGALLPSRRAGVVSDLGARRRGEEEANRGGARGGPACRQSRKGMCQGAEQRSSLPELTTATTRRAASRRLYVVAGKGEGHVADSGA